MQELFLAFINHIANCEVYKTYQSGVLNRNDEIKERL